MTELPPDPDKLIEDLAGAEHDILSLVERHGLSLGGLAEWACRDQTRRVLAGLCMIADAQTQLLLSRYRLVAATRLIAQATADADTLAPEQVRKACVDLLKTELPRAAHLRPADAPPADAEFDSLQDALMRSNDQDPPHATPTDADQG